MPTTNTKTPETEIRFVTYLATKPTFTQVNQSNKRKRKNQMLVTVIPNRNPNAEAPVLAMVDNMPAWFPRGVVYPVGTEVEVMITKAIHPVSRATQQPDLTSIRAFHIREVEPTDILCEHEGFYTTPVLGPRSYGIINGCSVLVYPGPVGVYVADPSKGEPQRKGSGWVEEKVPGVYDLVGLPSTDELAPYVWAGMPSQGMTNDFKAL